LPAKVTVNLQYALEAAAYRGISVGTRLTPADAEMAFSAA
jgi:hypothetical protein